jgi:Exostosin family
MRKRPKQKLIRLSIFIIISFVSAMMFGFTAELRFLQLGYFDDTKLLSTAVTQQSSSIQTKIKNSTTTPAPRFRFLRITPPLPYEILPTYEKTSTWNWISQLDSPLKDKSVPWRKRIRRIWWDRKKPTNPPPAILVLTKYGWNQKTQHKSFFCGRSMRQRELLEGTLNHPWFHPLEWDNIVQNRTSPRQNVRYYIFLDLETCGDKNYPNYLNRRANLDQYGRRGQQGTLSNDEAIQSVLQGKVMTQNPGSKLIIYDCLGYTKPARESLYWTRDNNQDDRIVLASISATPKQQLEGDMGLPPGPCIRCNLTHKELVQIDSCDAEHDRPYLLTFAGNFRANTRQTLRQLHNGQDIIIGTTEEVKQIFGVSDEKESFRKLSVSSKFAAVPRGDNLFSYRFTEVLGCGAIPVVYANDWVFPFRKELIEPSEYAVILKEEDVLNTVQVLAQIPHDVRCRLRQNGVNFYEKYLKTGEGVIKGIVESLELLHARKETKYGRGTSHPQNKEIPTDQAFVK